MSVFDQKKPALEGGTYKTEKGWRTLVVIDANNTFEREATPEEIPAKAPKDAPAEESDAEPAKVEKAPTKKAKAKK